MKIKMYSSAFAMMAVLGGCLSSNDDTTSTPTTPVTPASNVTQAGDTTTFNKDADARTQNLARAAGLNPVAGSPEAAGVIAAKLTLASDNTALTDSTGFRTDIQNLTDLSTPAKVSAANTLIGQFNTASGVVLPAVVLNDDLNVTLTAAQVQIDTVLVPNVTTSETNLAAAYPGTAVTNGPAGVQNRGQIVLADGTILQTRAFGQLSTDATGEFASSQLVAAFEQNALGRVTRVAFVEATGVPYVADASTNYNAFGSSVIGVQVDGGLFDKLDGTSNVNLNVATQSGTVTANAFSVDQFDAPTLNPSQVFYSSDVVFDPTTGAFTSSNGQVVYTTFNTGGGGAGTVITQANNAELYGQLHGALATADFTGIVTATTDNMEVVGGIIGR